MSEMMALFIGLVATILSLGIPLFAIYLALYALRKKHRENMELIKQGIIPPSKNKSVPNKYRSLRNGFLCIGIALGIIVSFIIKITYKIAMPDNFFILGGLILLFLGIAYVAFYLIVRKKEDLDNELDNE